MSVYVDELFVAEAENPHALKVGERNGHQWCHMWADTGGELHRMANDIGLLAEWFQNRNPDFPHYDLTPGMRAKAIVLGAKPRRLKDLIKDRIRAQLQSREWNEEARYRREERLGILCGNAEPTREQKDLAEYEANAWLDSQANSKATVPKVTALIKELTAKRPRALFGAYALLTHPRRFHPFYPFNAGLRSWGLVF